MDELHGVIRLNPDVIFDDDYHGLARLIEWETGRSFMLDRIGAAIWVALMRGTSLDSLSRRLKLSLIQPPANLEEQIAGYLKELMRVGLLIQAT